MTTVVLAGELKFTVPPSIVVLNALYVPAPLTVPPEKRTAPGPVTLEVAPSVWVPPPNWSAPPSSTANEPVFEFSPPDARLSVPCWRWTPPPDAVESLSNGMLIELDPMYAFESRN